MSPSRLWVRVHIRRRRIPVGSWAAGGRQLRSRLRGTPLPWHDSSSIHAIECGRARWWIVRLKCLFLENCVTYLWLYRDGKVQDTSIYRSLGVSVVLFVCCVTYPCDFFVLLLVVFFVFV